MHKFYWVILLVFILLCGGIFIASTKYALIDLPLLYVGNLIMASMTSLAYYLVQRSLKGNPNAFIRGVYSGTLLKMMVFIIALVSYVMYNADTIHKPSLFVIFGFYLVYTSIETVFLGKRVKRTN